MAAAVELPACQLFTEGSHDSWFLLSNHMVMDRSRSELAECLNGGQMPVSLPRLPASLPPPSSPLGRLSRYRQTNHSAHIRIHVLRMHMSGALGCVSKGAVVCGVWHKAPAGGTTNPRRGLARWNLVRPYPARPATRRMCAGHVNVPCYQHVRNVHAGAS